MKTWHGPLSQDWSSGQLQAQFTFLIDEYVADCFSITGGCGSEGRTSHPLIMWLVGGYISVSCCILSVLGQDTDTEIASDWCSIGLCVGDWG